MEYKIIIQVLTPREGSPYKDSETIYEQIKADVDVEAVIAVVNELDK